MKLFNSPPMKETVKRLLRSQMAAKGVEYRELSVRLAQLGVEQSESNLRSKVTNGSLGAQLFIYIQLALGISTLSLAHVREILDDVSSELDGPETGGGS